MGNLLRVMLQHPRLNSIGRVEDKWGEVTHSSSPEKEKQQ